MSDQDSNRAFVISSTDRRGLIVIASTLLMSWMVLSFCIRLYTRIAITGSVKWDDVFAGLGTAVGVAQVGVTLRAVENGVGKSSTLFDPTELVKSQKDIYIANLLLILGHGAAKTSVLFLLRRIHRDKGFIKICHVALAVIVLWILGSALSISLQCDINKPWFLGGPCQDPTLRWQVIAAFDSLTEGVLFVMSVSLVWNLNMRWTGKAIVVGSFGSRLLLIPIIIVRLSFLRAATHSSDPSLEGADVSILSQWLLHYSLMAATIPCLKPFVIAFNTGWGQGLSNQGSSHYYYKRSALNTINNPAGSARNFELRNPTSGRFDESCQHETHVFVGNTAKPRENEAEGTEPMGSIVPQEMVIRQTREWSIEHECIEMDAHPS